jgi:hypothetical protein
LAVPFLETRRSSSRIRTPLPVGGTAGAGRETAGAARGTRGRKVTTRARRGCGTPYTSFLRPLTLRVDPAARASA